MTNSTVTMHATCVAIARRGVLITGPSGSGKSALALQLMAMGAALVSDDRTVLYLEEDALFAAPPPQIAGMIEARGIGIIHVQHLECARVVLSVDMAQIAAARLPELHTLSVLDIVLPCLHKVDAPYFPAAIHTYVSGMQREIK